MTPAIELARKKKIKFKVHDYIHDPIAPSYGEEAAVKLGVGMDRVFKTLVVVDHYEKMHVCIVPVSTQLDLKKAAKAIAVKKVKMAPADRVQASSGYVLGGVSPLGQKRQLPTYLDQSALEFETLYVSAGRRGLEIELAPSDLLKLTRGKSVPLSDRR